MHLAGGAQSMNDCVWHRRAMWFGAAWPRWKVRLRGPAPLRNGEREDLLMPTRSHKSTRINSLTPICLRQINSHLLNSIHINYSKSLHTTPNLSPIHSPVTLSLIHYHSSSFRVCLRCFHLLRAQTSHGMVSGLRICSNSCFHSLAMAGHHGHRFGGQFGPKDSSEMWTCKAFSQ